jgi:regulator of ribonuclease activity A
MTWTTPDLSDRFAQAAIVAADWRHYGGRHRFCGPVRTVRCTADNSRVRELANSPGHGQVLLVAGGGDRLHALLGDLIAAAAVANGWAGVVIDGCVRDVEILAGLDLGVMALGSCPRKTEKRGQGDVDVVVSIAGVPVSPGQFLYADASGIVVIEAAQAATVDNQ